MIRPVISTVRDCPLELTWTWSERPLPTMLRTLPSRETAGTARSSSASTRGRSLSTWSHRDFSSTGDRITAPAIMLMQRQSMRSASRRRNSIGSDTSGIQIDTLAHTLLHDSSASRAANVIRLLEIKAPIPYATPEGYDVCLRLPSRFSAHSSSSAGQGRSHRKKESADRRNSWIGGVRSVSVRSLR